MTPADGPGGTCGGQSTLVADGITWTCTFDSEFTGKSYNSQQWQVLTTNESGYFQGYACFENSPQNVSVGGGVLKLTVRRAAMPTQCGAFASDWTAGELTSYQRFDQTYGRIAIDAKFPPAKKSGLQSSLWLWPESLTQDSEGGKTAEIDIAEWFSEYPDLAIPTIHYDPSSTNKEASGINAVSDDHCVIDQSAFNEYVLEWTPTTITMIYNGKTCLEDTWEPAAPETAPEPFNQPFFICLTQTLGVETNQFNPATTPLPATTEIKYVRVWQGNFAN